MMFHHLSGNATKSCVERSMLRCPSLSSFSLVISVRIKITSTSVCLPKGNKESSLNSGRRLIRSSSGYVQTKGSQQRWRLIRGLCRRMTT